MCAIAAAREGLCAQRARADGGARRDFAVTVLLVREKSAEGVG